MNKKQWPIVALLAAVLLAGCLKAGWTASGRAPAAREFCLGGGAIPHPSGNGEGGEWIGAYVWFGGIKWRVLEKSPELYLLADCIPQAYRNQWADMPYWDDAEGELRTKDWRHSAVRAYLNTQLLATAFTGEEREAINYTDRSSRWYNNPEDKLFLPGPGDIINEELGFGREADEARRYDSAWWLRDQGGLRAAAASGQILDQPVPGGGKALRPACCLNKEMVVYTRDAAFLPEDAAGAQLMDFKDRKSASGEWVLALSCAGQHVTVDSVRLEEGRCVIGYRDAAVGRDNYISAVITDQNGEDVFYYGKIARTDRDSCGQAEITIPRGYQNHYRVMIFSEQKAEARETVRASRPVAVLNGRTPAELPVVSRGALPGDAQIEPLNTKISRAYDPYLLWTGDDYRAADQEEKFRAGTAILLYQELLTERADRLSGSAVHEGVAYALEHPDDITELAEALFGLADIMETNVQESMEQNYELSGARKALHDSCGEIDLPGYAEYLDYTGEMYEGADEGTKGGILTAAVAYMLKYRLNQEVDEEVLEIIRADILSGGEELEPVIDAYETFFALRPALTIREMMNYAVE